MLNTLAQMRTYSTAQAAEQINIHPITLHRWLRRGLVRTSIEVPLNGRILRRWTKADVEKARKMKGTLKPGRKAKGRER
jgi:hypothetical protein